MPDQQAPSSPAPEKLAQLSPAMRQYQQFKSQYPGYVLFFRMGDFYEMFWDDAIVASKTLGVALTSRSRGGPDAQDAIPMAGVPFHAVEAYLRKMIAAGHKVAICEQMEDAAAAKGVVKRDVVRLMTPGTITDDPLLDGHADNFLAALAFHVTAAEGYRVGLAWVELSTGSCVAMSGAQSQVLDEIARLDPAEILVPENPSGEPHEITKALKELGVTAITARPGWQFTLHHAREQLARQWQTATAGGFGFADDDPGVFAAAAVLTYLEETQKTALAHLRPCAVTWSMNISTLIRPPGAAWRLTAPPAGAAPKVLCSALSTAPAPPWAAESSASGCARHCAIWSTSQPANPPSPLFWNRPAHSSPLSKVLMTSATSSASSRAWPSTARSPATSPALAAACSHFPNSSTTSRPCRALTTSPPNSSSFAPSAPTAAAYLATAIKPDPATHLREGNVIAGGFDPELDRLREIDHNSQQWLARYQAKLSTETSIPSLKVSYNRVFGYYIEVTNVHRDKVPTSAGWIRKQTTTNAERYITEELKKFEEEALGARDRSILLEQQLFEKIRQELLPHLPKFQDLADALARLDVLSSLAALAQERRYCRPVLSEERVLEIIDGRHPVLEQQLGSEFVCNDVRFGEDDSLMLITGPNMAGKSTFIRQVALITLLAQIGSYVPAKSATIGIADRLFTRIGASDELHSGQSTFMVEMTETANILNNATDRSLVILDEIGRGTSTLDGLSLAWSIAEHLASNVCAAPSSPRITTS